MSNDFLSLVDVFYYLIQIIFQCVGLVMYFLNIASK